MLSLSLNADRGLLFADEVSHAIYKHFICLLHIVYLWQIFVKNYRFGLSAIFLQIILFST